MKLCKKAVQQLKSKRNYNKKNHNLTMIIKGILLKNSLNDDYIMLKQIRKCQKMSFLKKN